jgi:hypothetical protein
MKKVFKASGLLLVLLLTFFACKKEVSNQEPKSQQVSIYLTDDPGLFDSVLINIQSVRVKIDTCSSDDDDDPRGDDDDDDDDNCYVWKTLNIRAGFYDLLRLRNGIDTLLAQGDIPAGEIEKVKLVLGTGHYLVKDDIRYPLNMMPGRRNEVELKLKGKDWDDFASGRRRIWLDFDVARSIVQVRNGQFFLAPVLRPFVVSRTGGIKGEIKPLDSKAVISVYNNKDTAYAIPTLEGEFKVRGLLPGNYDVLVNASNGYRDTTIKNVAVVSGRDTDLKKIVLRK